MRAAPSTRNSNSTSTRARPCATAAIAPSSRAVPCRRPAFTARDSRTAYGPTLTRAAAPRWSTPGARAASGKGPFCSTGPTATPRNTAPTAADCGTAPTSVTTPAAKPRSAPNTSTTSCTEPISNFTKPAAAGYRASTGAVGRTAPGATSPSRAWNFSARNTTAATSIAAAGWSSTSSTTAAFARSFPTTETPSTAC